MSLFLLAQIDTYTYFVSSIRVKGNILDTFSIILNMLFSVTSLVWFSYVSTRNSAKLEFYYKLVKSQFLHFKKGLARNLRPDKRHNFPVVIVHTSIFALKSSILAVFSLAAGWNVYAYCVTTSVLAGV